MGLGLRYGEAYAAQQEQQFAAEVRDRQERQLHRRARELGYELEKIEKPTPASEPATESEAK